MCEVYYSFFLYPRSGLNKKQVIMGNEFSCSERNFLQTPTEVFKQEDDGTDDYFEGIALIKF